MQYYFFTDCLAQGLRNIFRSFYMNVLTLGRFSSTSQGLSVSVHLKYILERNIWVILTFSLKSGKQNIKTFVRKDHLRNVQKFLKGKKS